MITRRDALKTIAAIPLVGGLAASVAPAAECGCDCGCDMPAVLDCTISPCYESPSFITLSNPAGIEVRYEWNGDWWKPVGDELPEGFPKGFRWDENLELEEMEPGVGIVSPCCPA